MLINYWDVMGANTPSSIYAQFLDYTNSFSICRAKVEIQRRKEHKKPT